MPDYRTPEMDHADLVQEQRVQAVLDQAVRDGASLVAAIHLAEPDEVVELWIDRLWDGLRDGLRDRPGRYAGEDRLRAIVLLLTQRIHAEADTVVRSIGEAGA